MPALAVVELIIPCLFIIYISKRKVHCIYNSGLLFLIQYLKSSSVTLQLVVY